MAYGWQLISDLHPIPGADRPVRRLPDLIDMTFLFEIGWDPATAVITLPSHHPLLGYSQCPVLGCSAAAASSAPGLCDYCNAQWQTVKDRTGWATFVSTRRTVFAQRNKIDPTRLDLSRYSPLLRDQVLAVICMQRHSGRPQLAVMLRLLLRWIDTRKITTLEEPSLLRSKPRQDGGVADFCRTACEHLQLALTHPEIEKRKDVWDLRVFGYPNRHLSFTGGGCRRGSSKSTPALSQRWLRETCKEFVYQSALPRQLSISTISTYLRAAAHLSATLAARADRGEDPAALGRADIVDHLVRLNAVVRTGRMSDADHHRYYVFTRRLLREIVGLGLTGPGGPAEGLPADFGVRHTDTVKWVRTLREDDVSGEALSEIVVEQLFSPASLAVLGARHVFPEQCRRLVRVLADTGRRPTR